MLFCRRPFCRRRVLTLSFLGALAALAAGCARMPFGESLAPPPPLPTPDAYSSVPDQPDSRPIANIPVNYIEAKVGDYTLTHPLVCLDGSPATSVKAWNEKRRPEILKMFEENQYGRVPEAAQKHADMSFDFFDKGTPALDGKATRQQATVYFTKDKTKDYVDVVIYLPADAKGPVPLLLAFGWTANNLSYSDDPGVKVGRTWSAQTKTRTPAAPTGRPGFGRVDPLPVLAAGMGFATFNYNDIDPDSLDSVSGGIRAAFLKPGETAPAPDEWGSIAAWAWGAGRIVDFMETDPQIDAKRIAVFGVSRLGKTVAWTGASDPRIACVIASCGGEGGAALSSRNYGETIAHLVAPSRYPYQFCANYAKRAEHPELSGMDSHMLLSLVAPRPILLQTGKTDGWSDPKGEFLAAVAAGPVYELFGKQGLGTLKMPEAGQPILHDLGYYMHAGGHGSAPGDWPTFIDFLKMHLQSKP